MTLQTRPAAGTGVDVCRSIANRQWQRPNHQSPYAAQRLRRVRRFANPTDPITTVASSPTRTFAGSHRSLVYHHHRLLPSFLSAPIAACWGHTYVRAVRPYTAAMHGHPCPPRCEIVADRNAPLLPRQVTQPSCPLAALVAWKSTSNR